MASQEQVLPDDDIYDILFTDEKILSGVFSLFKASDNANPEAYYLLGFDSNTSNTSWKQYDLQRSFWARAGFCDTVDDARPHAHLLKNDVLSNLCLAFGLAALGRLRCVDDKASETALLLKEICKCFAKKVDVLGQKPDSKQNQEVIKALLCNKQVEHINTHYYQKRQNGLKRDHILYMDDHGRVYTSKNKFVVQLNLPLDSQESQVLDAACSLPVTTICPKFPVGEENLDVYGALSEAVTSNVPMAPKGCYQLIVLDKPYQCVIESWLNRLNIDLTTVEPGEKRFISDDSRGAEVQEESAKPVLGNVLWFSGFIFILGVCVAFASVMNPMFTSFLPDIWWYRIGGAIAVWSVLYGGYAFMRYKHRLEGYEAAYSFAYKRGRDSCRSGDMNTGAWKVMEKIKRLAPYLFKDKMSIQTFKKLLGLNEAGDETSNNISPKQGVQPGELAEVVGQQQSGGNRTEPKITDLAIIQADGEI